MGILKKTMSVLVLVFFVASLTVGSASAGHWKDKCDCHKDKCDCHKDKCKCHKDKCDCDNFDFESFFGGSFFGNDCFFGDDCFYGDNDFFGEDGNWFDGW
ncbi:hypothetical protein [Methanosarcina sp. UBA5]|uniref:hypothetical protein n=1 Tax=Methanosarcina sp. UBA5 TaxID=1915593 RepID=UPI0025F90D7C|nr:hypothetical protein [Methanosarcina sp. UBA5]